MKFVVAVDVAVVVVVVSVVAAATATTARCSNSIFYVCYVSTQTAMLVSHEICHWPRK